MNTFTNTGTQSVGTGTDTLSLYLGEDQYAGDIEFTVFINNQLVGSVYTVQALQSQSQDQQFFFNGNWGAQATVTINFINGASDSWLGNGNTRKLYIDGANYDGNALVLPANSLTGEFKNTSVVTLTTNQTTTLAAASDMTVVPGGLGSLLNLSGYHLTYDDEFGTMPTMSPVAGQAQYDTTLAAFPNLQGMRILGNGDQQYYTDSTTGQSPFSIVNGALAISATYVGAGNTPAGGGATGPSYTSGQITTEGSFSQQYGYFEMRAELPQGVGMWPAFWMLDNSSYLAGGWDPELDVMEAFGSAAVDGEGGPTQSHWAVHTPTYSPGGWATLPNGGNAYTGYNTYGVLWTPQTISLYIDGIQIGQMLTPADFTEQMYMIVNLAVGGSWPGNATGENAKMSIDYLRAYSSNIAIPAVALQKLFAPDGNADTNLYGATALNTSPILAITSLKLAHDTGASGADYITNNGSVTFSGTVQDASSVSIDIYDNGADLGKATVTGASWTFATTLGAGSHALSAEASDTSGNVGSINATQTITVETTPPTVAVASVTPTTSGLAIAGTVSGPPGTTIELYAGTTALAAATVQSNGSWNSTLKLSAGTYDLTAHTLDLAGNTSVSPDKIATVSPPAAADKLTLAISEDAWKGDVQFTVSVDGKQVGGTMAASALHFSGNSNMVVLSGNWGAGAHNVQITFINDAYGGSPTTDRNLYVDAIAYDGVTYSNTAAVLFQDSSQNFAVGGTTAAGIAPADALTVHLSEDAWNGNAQFQLLVDGKVVTTPQQVVPLQSAGAWQDLSFSSSFGGGSHTIGVQFLNDAYGGSPSADRNLYVNGIDVNGIHYGSGVTALYTNSTANFVITTTH